MQSLVILTNVHKESANQFQKGASVLKKIYPILALTLLLLITGCSNKEEKNNTKSNSDIHGTWYSDNPRRSSDTITFNKDGSFTGWFSSDTGTYEFNKKSNEIVFIHDNDTRTMKVSKGNEVITYENGPFIHNYYRDKKMAEVESENRKQDVINDVTEQLIGSWGKLDSDFDSTYIFNEDGSYENNIKYLGTSPVMKNRDLSTYGTYTVNEYTDTTDISIAEITFATQKGTTQYKKVLFIEEDDILKLKLDNDVYTK